MKQYNTETGHRVLRFRVVSFTANFSQIWPTGAVAPIYIAPVKLSAVYVHGGVRLQALCLSAESSN